jgi:hypothetical protein
MVWIDAETSHHCKLLVTLHGAVFNKYVEGIIDIYASISQPVSHEASRLMLRRREIL